MEKYPNQFKEKKTSLQVQDLASGLDLLICCVILAKDLNYLGLFSHLESVCVFSVF